MILPRDKVFILLEDRPDIDLDTLARMAGCDHTHARAMRKRFFHMTDRACDRRFRRRRKAHRPQGVSHA